jgi:hypothetical protein
LKISKMRFSLSYLMLIIAICACFIPMLGGISAFFSYRGSKVTERSFRDAASAIRRQTKEEPPDHAAAWKKAATELEQRADLAAGNAQRNWDVLASAMALVGLGLISGGLAITLRVWYGPGIPTRSRPAYYLFSVCSTLALVLLVAFSIAASVQVLTYAQLYILGKLC